MGAQRDAAATLLYDEAVSGDLSDTPAALPALTAGSNTVHGSVTGAAGGDFRDRASFIVPGGFVLEKLLIIEVDASGLHQIFVSLLEGTDFATAATIGFNNLAGFSILPSDLLQTGAAPGAQGPGRYFLDIGPSADTSSSVVRGYTLDLQLASVPQPATLPLLLAGLAGLAVARRRRSA